MPAVARAWLFPANVAASNYLKHRFRSRANRFIPAFSGRAFQTGNVEVFI